MKYYLGLFLQLLGLVITTYAMIFFFGKTGPLMKSAAVGAVIFYLGRVIYRK